MIFQDSGEAKAGALKFSTTSEIEEIVSQNEHRQYWEQQQFVGIEQQ